MIAYHGSNHNFETLRISKSLVNNRNTLDNEGAGIYFSTDLDIAKSYGKYVYKLEINDKYILDFRNKKVCEKYLEGMLEYMQKQTLNGISMLNYIDYNLTVRNMCAGGISIYRMSSEIRQCLDNNFAFYNANSNTRREAVYRAARRYEKEKLQVYMFRYCINNIGVIKDTSPNIVRVVEKVQSYLL